MIDIALNTYLDDQSEITNLVSTRIYPLVAPQNPIYPFLSFQTINTVRDKTLSGESGLRYTDFRVISAAKTYREAKELAAAVMDNISDYRGDMSGTQVIKTIIFSEDDQFEPNTESFISSFVLRLWYYT